MNTLFFVIGVCFIVISFLKLDPWSKSESKTNELNRSEEILEHSTELLKCSTEKLELARLVKFHSEERWRAQRENEMLKEVIDNLRGIK